MKEGWWGEPLPEPLPQAVDKQALDKRVAGCYSALRWVAPFEVFLRFAHTPNLAFLESREPYGTRSRYSYLAVDPFLVLRAAGGTVYADDETIDDDPFTAVERLLARYAVPAGPAPVPFCGGAVGFFGYELGGILETLPRATGEALGFPDMSIGFYDVVFAFDHAAEQAWLISSGLPALQPHARAERAQRRMAAAMAGFNRDLPASRPRHSDSVWRADTSHDVHVARVEETRRLIEAGDIYQANITARFRAARPAGISCTDIFARVRAGNPAPFTAFLDCGDGRAIVSASPERALVLSADGRVEARPIKGSRRRGATAQDDAALREELLKSCKDRAENLMIVDLLRHDIARVAAFGSVEVPELCGVESFAHIHHLVSTIKARLRPELGPVDLLRAVFPGGSVTGAPKIRAMQIIAELEACPRGPYCGMAAWIGFDGAMDSSILIRTVLVTPDCIATNAGGGIVADSDPADEFDEMMLKAGPLLRSLGRLA